MKTTLILALAAVALTTACNTAPALTTFTNSNITSSGRDTTVKVNFPLAQNNQNKAVADSINSYVESLVNQLPTLNKEDQKIPGDTIHIPIDAYMSWEVNANAKIIHLQTNQYTYTGGAHGSTQILTRTFNAATGRRVNFLDYVKKPQDMLGIIHDQLTADSVYLFTPVAEVPMPQNFLINAQGVTALYNQYEIAPYSSGIIEVPMPYTQLENILDIEAFDAYSLSTQECPID